MAKKILFKEDARYALERGVNALADAVKVDVYKRQVLPPIQTVFLKTV